MLLMIFCDLCYSLRCHAALQICLYLALDNVIESMSMPHDDSDNRGDSDVELVGGGCERNFGRFYTLFVMNCRENDFWSQPSKNRCNIRTLKVAEFISCFVDIAASLQQ